MDYAPKVVDFPLVIAPNFSMLLIKFMHMLQEYGRHFQGYDIAILESHQAAKMTTAGTAVEMARSLGLSDKDVSVRDASVQQHELRAIYPAEFLEQHAVHLIKITDGSSVLTFRTEVMGLD